MYCVWHGIYIYIYSVRSILRQYTTKQQTNIHPMTSCNRFSQIGHASVYITTTLIKSQSTLALFMFWPRWYRYCEQAADTVMSDRATNQHRQQASQPAGAHLVFYPNSMRTLVPPDISKCIHLQVHNKVMCDIQLHTEQIRPLKGFSRYGLLWIYIFHIFHLFSDMYWSYHVYICIAYDICSVQWFYRRACLLCGRQRPCCSRCVCVTLYDAGAST